MRIHKNLFVGVFSFVICLGEPMAFAQGVYSSENISSQRATQKSVVEKRVGEFIRQEILRYVLTTTQDVIRRAVSTQKIEILPQMAQLSIQQSTMQLFKQPLSKEMIQEAYRDVYEQAMDQIDLKTANDIIQRDIKSNIDLHLGTLPEDPVFQFVVEQVVQQTMFQQQMIVTQYALQQQLQIMAQQQQNAQNEMQKVYQDAINSTLIQ